MMQPTIREMPKDPIGKEKEALFATLTKRLNSNPRDNVYPVVTDGYAGAIFADGQYLVYEEYHGADGRTYPSYRPANEFEAHLLRKIEGLNKFFIE